MVSNQPTPIDEDPPVFLPQKWWEWVVVVIATIIWWMVLFGLAPTPSVIPVRISLRALLGGGGGGVFLLFALVLGPPVLMMMATRGIGWMIEQRNEAAKKAARRAKDASKKSGPTMKYGK